MRVTITIKKVPNILLVGLLCINAAIDIFLGTFAFGNKNLMVVGILAIAFAVQGMVITKIVKNSFYL